jgi:hypothetical protein
MVPIAVMVVALFLIPSSLAHSTSAGAATGQKRGALDRAGFATEIAQTATYGGGSYLGLRSTPTSTPPSGPGGIVDHPTFAGATGAAIASASASTRASARVSPLVASPVLVNKFTGLNQSQSGGWGPPDPQLALNKNYVFELVNEEARITTKTGSSVSSFSMQSFFGTTSTNNVGDVQVIFDNQSGRWVFSADDFTTNFVYFAVSTTGNPTGTWYTYSWYTTFGVSDTMDQPVLGYSHNQIGWNTNQYNSSGFVGTILTIGTKANLYHGTFALKFFGYGSYFSVHPARQIVGNGTGTDVFYWATSVYGSSSGTLTVFKSVISGTTFAITSFSETIAYFFGPQAAVQPGTSTTLDTDDSRVQAVGWANSVLWVAFSDSCIPTGDGSYRSCVRVDAVSTSSETLLQDSDIGIAGHYLYYAALTPLHVGNGYMMVVGFSGPLEYPSMAVTGQASSDSYNTYRGPIPVFSGTGVDTSGRYGDYFAAQLDISNAKLCWAVGEINQASGAWATEVVKFSF